jgi:hypothetical protein
MNFIEIEDYKIGLYDQKSLDRFETMLNIAAKYGIRVKFCLEISLGFDNKNFLFNKKSYKLSNGGPFVKFWQYIDTEDGRRYYLDRVKKYANRLKNNPTIYCWELWNEMNAILKEIGSHLLKLS